LNELARGWPLRVERAPGRPALGQLARDSVPPRTSGDAGFSTDLSGGITPPLTSTNWMFPTRKSGWPASSMGAIGRRCCSARAISRSTHTDLAAAGLITTTSTAQVSTISWTTSAQRSP
jgi:hypothetical protein